MKSKTLTGITTSTAIEANMKCRTLMGIIAVMLLTALATPLRLVAQDQKKTHHHYKLIDLGTFGGPQGYFVSLVGRARTEEL